MHAVIDAVGACRSSHTMWGQLCSNTSLYDMMLWGHVVRTDHMRLGRLCGNISLYECAVDGKFPINYAVHFSFVLFTKLYHVASTMFKVSWRV